MENGLHCIVPGHGQYGATPAQATRAEAYTNLPLLSSSRSTVLGSAHVSAIPTYHLV